MDFLLPHEQQYLYSFFGQAPPKKETTMGRLKNFTKREDVKNAVGRIKTLPTKGQHISRKVSARTKEWRKIVKDLAHDDVSTAVTESTGRSISAESISHATGRMGQNERPANPKPSPFSMKLSCLGSTITCGNAFGCIPDEDDDEGDGLFGALSAIRDKLLCKSVCGGDNMLGKCVEFQMCRNVVYQDGDAEDELTLTWDCSSFNGFGGCNPFNCGDNSLASGDSFLDDDSILSLDATPARRSIVPPLALLVYAGKEETCIEVGDPDLLDAYHNALVLLAMDRQVIRFDEADDKLHPLVLAHGANIPEQSIEIEWVGIMDQHLAVVYVQHFFKVRVR